jgi:cytoplasmic iron level regulating protein YaaA (DUF328/UPF0246 family)
MRNTLKIIISPAKKMNVETDILKPLGMPVFLEKANEIKDYVQSLTYEEAKKLWGCNDKLAELNFGRFQRMNLEKALTPALLSYEGIQYQYMAPKVFQDGQWKYVQEHLRILSGFYGVLKPLDGVVPYRMEMQARAVFGGAKNLYEFWGETIYHEISKDTSWILNLASKEYSQCIEKYLEPQIPYITCVFGEERNGKIVQKGTLAKMARGEMVRFLSLNNITEPEGVKKFRELGFRYSPEHSRKDRLVFVKSK